MLPGNCTLDDFYPNTSSFQQKKQFKPRPHSPQRTLKQAPEQNQTDELVETTPQYFIEFKSLISDVLTFTLIMSKQMLSTFVPDLFILF